MDAAKEPAKSALYPGEEYDAAWRRLVCPEDYVNPEPKARYHLVVIGAGTAGLVTAIAAAGLGAKVALIEKHALGGDCLNVGCVPSKALLEHARRAGGRADFDAAFTWLRNVRAQIAQHDSVQRYREAGVDVFLGKARFVDERTVEVGEHRLTARRTVIATGARAALPPIPGLVDSRPLTNETVFDLRRPPTRLAILGGGPIGSELAQAMARLGVQVELIEIADRILSNEIAEAGRIVSAALERDGVRLKLGVKVESVARHGATASLDTSAGKIVADELLVAVGRRPNTEDLNLAAVGVDVDQAGRIVVDAYLRTTNPKIYAAGDVCSTQQFTHNSDAHARICVQNALFVPSATTRKLVIPHCTYTDPEVAQVGKTGADLDRNGTPYDLHRVEFDALDRGRLQRDEVSFAEVLTARGRDRILGATIVGPDAGEQIAIICAAITNDLGLGGFAKIVLPYPTRAEYLRRLADNYNRTRLTPTVQRVMQAWLRWKT